MTPQTGSRDASPVARGAAIAALVLAVVLIAVLLFRGDGGTEYTVRFQNAGQLVKGDDIQIGGRRVGQVEKIDLTDNNEAAVKIKLISEFSPLHDGTRATIRATSLSGIANRYIALTPGPNDAKKLDDGGVLTADRTTTPVDLDQLFNALDPPTRRNLANVVKGFANQYAGSEAQANASAKYFAPSLSTTQQLISELLRDQPAFTRFLIDSSKVVGSLAERRNDLSGLVGNANATAAAIAQENTALDSALSLLPGTLRKANTTFVNLRATLGDLDTLTNASKPATKRLAPLLRELRPLVAAARPTIHDLRLLVGTRGPNNDLTDATKKLPRLQSIASPVFKRQVVALRRSQKVLEFIRPYAPDLVGWLRDFGQGASNYDANGHFARIQPIFNAFNFNDATGVLTPLDPNKRFDGLQRNQLARCPGAASQFPADGSAPFTDGGKLDCDPSLRPPGP